MFYFDQIFRNELLAGNILFVLGLILSMTGCSCCCYKKRHPWTTCGLDGAGMSPDPDHSNRLPSLSIRCPRHPMNQSDISLVVYLIIEFMILHQPNTSIHSMYKIYFQDLSSKINARENEYSHSGNLGLTTYLSAVQPQHLNP